MTSILKSYSNLLFDTVADLKLASLQVGESARTLGYTTAGDGGGAEYTIVASGTGTDDGGSFHDLANGNQAELVVNDVINVKQFGAVGDGVADDTTAVQTFFTYLASNQLAGADSGGVYLMNAGVSLTGKFSFRGGGYSENSGNGSVTEFLKSSAATGDLFTINSPAVSLSNFAIEGQSGNTGDGLVILNVACSVEDVACHNQGGTGMRYGTDTPGGANCNNNFARNIIAHSNGVHGIYFHQPDGVGSSDCNAGTFINLFGQTNGDEGIRVEEAAANTFIGCTVQLNVSYGVACYPGSSQNLFLGGDFNENNDTGGGGPYDLFIDPGSEQNAFIWVALNPAKILNSNNPETFFLTEDFAPVLNAYSETTAVATGTNTIAINDTIPQITDGDQYLEVSIARGYAVASYDINIVATVSHTVATTTMAVALFEAGVNNALASTLHVMPNSNDVITLRLQKRITAPAGTTTYRVRIGAGNAGTTTLNGAAGSRLHGGVLTSSISITQVQAV